MEPVSNLPENVRAAFSEHTLLSMPALASLLGIDIKTLKKHVERGDLPGRVKGFGASRKHWVFSIQDVSQFLLPHSPDRVRQSSSWATAPSFPGERTSSKSGMPRMRRRFSAKRANEKC